MPDQETEITLGIGKLLGMFFGLVLLCGVFFVAGYSMGKNNAGANATLMETSVPATVPNASIVKPAATQVVRAKADCSQTPQGCAPAEADAIANTPAAAPVVVTAAAPRAPDPAPAKPEARPAAPNSGTYIVQVAAISNRQDAEALVAALHKKQYPVFVANQTSDSLFHVQIGPFSDGKEAEATRTRLIADGYNPIVKK